MTYKDNKIWNTENPFQVPNGYFENINNQIHNKIDLRPTTDEKKPRILSVFAPWIGLVAAFFIIALVYRQLPERIYPNRFNTNQTKSELIDELSPWYLPNDYELMEYLSGKENLDLNIYPDSIIFENLNEENLTKLTLFQ